MAVNFTKLAALAARLIKSSGRQIDLIKSGDDEVFDPIQGQVTSAGTSVTLKPWALVLTPELGEMQYGSQFAADQTTRQKGQRLIMAVGDGKPEIGDKVSIDSTLFNVEGVNVLGPSGIDIIYYVSIKT